MTGPQPGSTQRGKAPNGPVDNDTNKNQSNKNQSNKNQSNKNQSKSLEEAQLKFNNLKDQHDKLMEYVERLLGICALSGFTAILSKTTWTNITCLVQRGFLFFGVIALLIAVVVSAAAIILDVGNHIDTPMLPDATEPEHAQSKGKALKNLIQTWDNQSNTLEGLTKWQRRAATVAYSCYAFALEGIIFSFFPLQ